MAGQLGCGTLILTHSAVRVGSVLHSADFTLGLGSRVPGLLRSLCEKKWRWDSRARSGEGRCSEPRGEGGWGQCPGAEGARPSRLCTPVLLAS